MNVASALNPLKYKVSEKINDNKAAINNSLSDVVNFLNMSFFFLNCYTVNIVFLGVLNKK